MDEKKKKELLKIDFNKNAPGTYWYLYLIEKIGFSEKTVNVKLNFINTKLPNNFYNGFNPCREFRQTIVRPVEVLFFLEAGMIYDTERDVFIEQSEYYNDVWNVTIDFSPLHEKLNETLPFLNSKYSPLSNDDDLEGLSYYFLDLPDNKVIITDNVLSKYFSFKSTKFISRLITNGINELFDINNIKIEIDKNGKKVGYLRYNNDLIGENDIKSMSCLFFIKNNKGINYLKSLETKIVSYFINNKDNQKKLSSGIYLDATYPFNENISYVLQGKRFQVGNEYYFIAEKIVSHISKINEFIVDRVELVEFNPKDSTNERDEKEKEKIDKPGQPKKNKLELTSNISGNPHGNIQDNPISVKKPSGFSLPTTKQKRDTQKKAYDVTVIPNNQELDGQTIVVQNSDNDTLNQRNNFFEEINILKINKFNLMNLVTEILKAYGVKIENNYLNKSILETNVYDFYNSKVMVISLCYENKYFYIIDFEKSSGGFIRSNFMTKIDPLTLELFIKQCLKINNDLKNDKSKKGLGFWTRIRIYNTQILEKFGIIIETPFDHPIKDLNSELDAAEKIAKKIFNDRINKISA